jgi:RimJ/RimL family protein N-acetyltransferase
VVGAPRPPETLDIGGGVQLRRHRVDDAEGIAAAVAESLPELRTWMPWATEEAARPEAQRSRLEQLGPRWDHGSEYAYVILVDGRVIGSMGLHARIEPGALELGYWVHSGYTGRGITTACARGLTAAALALPDINRVEIHCDQANTPSAAIARRLGYRLVRVDERDIAAPGETGRTMIWVYPPSEATAQI